MSMNNELEEDVTKRSYTKPYGGKHPIPTIKGYREHRKELEEQYGDPEAAPQQPEDDSRPRRAYDTAKSILKGQDDHQTSHDPYPVSNHNRQERTHAEDAPTSQPAIQANNRANEDTSAGKDKEKDKETEGKSATENAASTIDPRQKRKAMKKRKNAGGREVTDPVTHLPIVIYDQTDKDLSSAPENNPVPGSHSRTATGLEGATKSQSELSSEQQELQRSYNGLQKTFPPPSFREVEDNLASVYQLALTVGLGAILSLAATIVLFTRLLATRESSGWAQVVYMSILFSILLGAGAFIIFGVRGWLGKKVSEVWDDETWSALREQEKQTLESDSELPESVQWLNSLLTSVWPMINPDLFASLVDTLEDVMQASLPKIVRMVSVDDMGQGSESIRILGIRWLPTGAASQSVGEDGHLKSPKENAESDRTSPGQGQQDQSADDGDDVDDQAETEGEKKDQEQKKAKEQEEEAMRAGMEAEEGDFVNMEVAFAYRARSTGKSMSGKAKHAHLYLKFYLPGGIAVPVWVELRGIMGIMRIRMQLTPDPPFFSVCTFTFLGQPKADLSCVPLSKHSLNLMDVPLISSFVQSAIDAALAEYVAPKSLTLDMKDMLMGEDFKKDTATRGVVWIYIKQARDFKEGDGGIGPMKGSSDSYVTVSWAKFGKPVAATRIITGDQAPNWHEWSSILVSPDELNANERLRLQLWDSDKWTADDDLGRVEVDLHDLMNNPKTKNKMCDRKDRFTGEDLEEEMPGTLDWAVGFFEKTRITDMQLQKQTVNKKIHTKQQMREHIAKVSERKLREAKLDPEHDEELHQQKVQDYKELEDDMIISAPPSKDYPSGILSIQIHNITGLGIEKPSKSEDDDQKTDREEEDDTDGDLPDSYCTIILNHRKIYKTRTKPKNAKPFFNAGTERFVKDWQTAEIIVSCRDSREREDDALLGVVYLPLKELFKNRSQLIDMFPLVGGIGFGRARISLVWRSVEIQLPPNLRGWDYGTLEFRGPIRAKGNFPNDLKQHRIKLRTNLGTTKYSSSKEDGLWHPRRKDQDDSAFLPVRVRYASALVLEFRKSSIGPDKTPAFAVLWLHDLTDDEEQTETLRVWKGGKDNLKRAESCCDYQGLEDDDQKLGEIEITLKFWPGLSGYHKAHANRSQNADVRNVMECLDTINDENMDDLYSDLSDDSSDDDADNTETDGKTKPNQSPEQSAADAKSKKKLRTHTNQSDSDDSTVESAESNGFSKVKAPVTTAKQLASKAADMVTGDQDNADNGDRGVRAQAKDYRDHRKQLHRKHKGVMQWKGARTADWAGGKVRRAKSRVEEVFQHSEKGQGIETEV